VQSGAVWASTSPVAVDGESWTLLLRQVQEQGIRWQTTVSDGGEPLRRPSALLPEASPSTRCLACAAPLLAGASAPGSAGRGTPAADTSGGAAGSAPGSRCAATGEVSPKAQYHASCHEVQRGCRHDFPPKSPLSLVDCFLVPALCKQALSSPCVREKGLSSCFLCRHARGQAACFSLLPERAGALAGKMVRKNVMTPPPGTLTLSGQL
jgi:hypothetical protein